jgi:MOSC domain-containing protein YiiM/ferredoxin-NADP reductase
MMNLDAIDTVLQETTLEEIRIGKVKRLAQTTIMTGIEKSVCQGPVRVSDVRIEGDEQGEAVIHGGPHKAVLQYARHHYDAWRKELPASAHLFNPGGFGENLVADGFDEENMCIGDVVEVGSVVLQVAQPRQPCFKLNHRFQQTSMSRRTQESHRTGWYYRVLRTGEVCAGDQMRVVERPHPQWTVSRVQDILYSDTQNLPAIAELVELEELAPDMRALLRKRLESMEVEEWNSRLIDEETSAIESLSTDERWTEVTVKSVTLESATVRSFELVAASGKRLLPSTPGAHVKVKLPNGLERAYSLCENSDGRAYRIGVGLSPSSRGASKWLHTNLKAGDTLKVSEPINTFPVEEGAGFHLMIGGGIGITPFLSMIQHFRATGARFLLHYCARSEKEAAFVEQLGELKAREVRFHFDGGAPQRGIDLDAVLEGLDTDTHVYCCGPEGLMKALQSKPTRLPLKNFHYEAFSASGVDDGATAFSVRIASSGQTLEVAAGRTVLEVLRQHAVDVPSSCESGSCGTCVVGYRDGVIAHNDYCLSPGERRTKMAVCVSRASSGCVTLDI